MVTAQWRRAMKVRFALGVAVMSIGAAVIAAQQQGANAVAIDADDIGGIVTSGKGPEAGVWVIAETRELPTRLARIVVTDDRGRYLVPDLPKANYDVWVRGYGLVDSPKVKAAPGKALNLTAVVAPNPKAAARGLGATTAFKSAFLPGDSGVFGESTSP